MKRMEDHHFLIISLPAQGHINPTFQLAKNLARAGARVTFATTVRGLNQIKTLPTLHGLFYASFSDGHDEDNTGTRGSSTGDFSGYMADLKRMGSENLAKLLKTLSDEGRPVTFLAYTILLPWAAAVAREMQVPSAFLFIQCAATFAIFHHFFSSRGSLHENFNPSSSIEILPGLPLFSCKDLPSFLLPGDFHHSTVSPIFQEHIKELEQEPNPCVLVNTLQELEEETIKAIDDMNLIAIGPLIPSAFSDRSDLKENSVGCDLFDSSKDCDYFQWLNSKPDGSVTYISFGSLVVFKKEQKEEIFQALVQTSRPFLWVIRSSKNGEEEEELIEGLINKHGLIGEGIVVPWCSQVGVLNHPSVGCFVTHCGWNSTLEGIAAGVPLICSGQFSDQTTNAKMVEEVWGNGVRAWKNEGGGVVDREELKRCFDVVFGDGERGKAIRRNATKLRELAADAVKEGGSSHRNLQQFLQKFA